MTDGKYLDDLVCDHTDGKGLCPSCATAFAMEGYTLKPLCHLPVEAIEKLKNSTALMLPSELDDMPFLDIKKPVRVEKTGLCDCPLCAAGIPTSVWPPKPPKTNTFIAQAEASNEGMALVSDLLAIAGAPVGKSFLSTMFGMAAIKDAMGELDTLKGKMKSSGKSLQQVPKSHPGKLPDVPLTSAWSNQRLVAEARVLEADETVPQQVRSRASIIRLIYEEAGIFNPDDAGWMEGMAKFYALRDGVPDFTA